MSDGMSRRAFLRGATGAAALGAGAGAAAGQEGTGSSTGTESGGGAASPTGTPSGEAGEGGGEAGEGGGGGGEGGGGESTPSVGVPDSAKSLGVASFIAMCATLGLAFFFTKYGGDYEPPEEE